MLPRTCVALLLLLSACATTEANRKAVAPDRRIANLRRAATLPWVDDGRCAVREASGEWAVLAERCYRTLDLDRVQFRDVRGKCAVAVAPAIAMGVGVCLLAAVELAAGVVVFVGSALVVATAIDEALAAYERSSVRERGRPGVRAPSSGNQPSADRRPVPDISHPPDQYDENKKDRCAAHYEKCIDAGGGYQPGNHKGQTLCGACLDYCTTHGFWPAAIPTMNGRAPCPGS